MKKIIIDLVTGDSSEINKRLGNIEKRTKTMILSLQKEISLLEIENSKIQNQRHELKKTIYSHRMKIDDLNERVHEMMSTSDQEKARNETAISAPHTTKTLNDMFIRHQRRTLVSKQQPRASRPAFYVYMSSNENSPGPHHTLIFNQVVSNIGNGYNQYTGIFTAPSTGVYVFSYTIMPDSGAYIPVEIIKNAGVIGSSFTRPYSSYRHSVSVTIVVHLTTGDVCYLRTSTSSTPSGNIYSSTSARTSFAGWLLV
ncbi:Hypothetical predicted protein [Mytilus galloprovincialis]|uniref:C1q domain-containing protein n=1 Tax=Mytilus galloprovincialis TaxID=29158 RepID=A0A8B6BKX6_MYTGA|nr:Hypothetical predicted protein [Mytilus galloprovincialis]